MNITFGRASNSISTAPLFDSKATIELLNDAAFLLENHVIQASQATGPLRQVYFVVQAPWN